ncbi:MAG: hypothetical protein WBA97_23740 [Actinophytocola sp.]|uniref:hypothetical protein n=1 Tax=Actinophytocola sp. TaxID=1872138 RepID=UPI003C76D630
MSATNEQEVTWNPLADLRRKHPRFFPRFDVDAVYSCIREIDPLQDTLSYEDCQHRLSGHLFHMGLPSMIMWRIFPRLLGAILLLSGMFALPFILTSVMLSATLGTSELFPTILAAGQIVLAIAGSFWLWTEGGWEARFFREIARILKIARETTDEQYKAVHCVNFAGKAARSLFCLVQQRRRTWASPPAVADLALAQSYPLIDVQLSLQRDANSLQRKLHLYVSFLYYAGALVAVRRHDLVPVLRQHYADRYSLARRESTVSRDEIPERDALYLDPMRNQNRWTVMKDYFYPLAAWFSLLVSIAALIVSLVG